VIAVVTAAIALTACSDGAGPNPAVGTEPAQTTTTNPYAVPTVIDATYVNKVLAGLDAQMGDVTRLILQTKTIPREAYDKLRAVYGDDQWLQGSIDSFQTDARKNFRTYKQNPGNAVTTVAQLISGTRSCLFARVTRDYSPVALSAGPPETQWVALRPLAPNLDPNHYNGTGWAFIFDGFAPNRVAPSDPCAS